MSVISDATTTFDVINPATEGLAGTAPICTADRLDQAMADAQGAFVDWSADEGASRSNQPPGGRSAEVAPPVNPLDILGVLLYSKAERCSIWCSRADRQACVATVETCLGAIR